MDSLISVNGYKHYRLDRRTLNKGGTTKKGGGIILYVKEGHSVVVHSNLSCLDKDLEVIIISCKIGNHKKINLTAVYRPPTGNLQHALDKLEIIINTIRYGTSGEAVVIGDMNIDLLNRNMYTTKLQRFMTTCNLEQIVSAPTRVTPRSSSLNDHIYTDIRHQSVSGVIDCNISDHFPVFLII